MGKIPQNNHPPTDVEYKPWGSKMSQEMVDIVSNPGSIILRVTHIHKKSYCKNIETDANITDG